MCSFTCISLLAFNLLPAVLKTDHMSTSCCVVCCCLHLPAAVLETFLKISFPGVFWLLYSYTHDICSRNWRRKIDSIFLAPVSGTCVMHIWYRKQAPNRTLYSKPETGVHMAEMIFVTGGHLFLVILCKKGVKSLVVIYLFTVIHRLRRQKFSFQTYVVRNTAAKNRRQKMESIYAANFWSMCHGY